MAIGVRKRPQAKRRHHIVIVAVMRRAENMAGVGGTLLTADYRDTLRLLRERLPADVTIASDKMKARSRSCVAR